VSTNYHTALTDTDPLNVPTIEAPLADLDAAIGTQAAAVQIKAALVYDSKSTTTDGGSASATTWNQRDLNTEVDPDSIVSISSNQFTPIAGTYMIWAEAPANEVTYNRIRLYNVTDTSVVKEGLNAYANTSNPTTTIATLFYVFTANGTDAYRIDHYTTSAKATTGLGAAVSDGSAETYTQVALLRLGD
jgi:hypothetical protein